MNVCFFGSYDPEYPRNKILLDGLEQSHVQIFHCRSDTGSLYKRYPELIRQYIKIIKKTDIIYVAFVGHLDMPLAWILGKLTRKKIVFDMFYSMYDTFVFDRKSMHQNSLTAILYFWIDKIAATLADHIVTDTYAHADYFIRLFKLNPKKFTRIFVGGDDAIFHSVKKNRRKITIVEFHGWFTQLHGAEYYVRAAKLLENYKNIRFLLIGNTTNYPLPIELYRTLKPKTMKYIPELTLTQLARVVADCDICIGHLGTTIKAKSVITNKMFHALASNTALIAGDCLASRELFRDRQTALFVKMGDPKDLAKKILYLSKHKRFRSRLARNGYDSFTSLLTNNMLGKQLLNVFHTLITSSN